MKLNKRFALAVISIITTIIAGYAIPAHVDSASKELKIEWFDVGAGDSMFIKLPNKKTVLIDAGTTSKGSIVVGKLKDNKIDTIDYCISTHPDMDHCGGLAEVFTQMNVKNFYYPDDTEYDTQIAGKVMDLAKEERGCNIISPGQGTVIKGGDGAKLEFVQNDEDYTSDNEDSLALLIEYGDLRVLTCGDNEKGSEEMIKQCNVDVLQLPHHGSKYAISYDFIKRFDPEYVVVSTDGKKYGHPDDEVFNICKKYDKSIQVYRTDRIGDIKLIATKKSWKFRKKGVIVGEAAGHGKSGGSGSGNSNSGSNGSAGTSARTTNNSGSKKAKVVYITKTGKKYHSKKTCRGLNNAKAIYKVKIKDVGNRDKCKICW